MTNSVKSATIAIITCRRPEWLERLLTALTKQVVDASITLDILVVDNACQDEAKQVVDSVNELSPFPITYQTESTPGIVAARNKCVSYFLTTDKQFLFFIDDDEWPSDEHWANNMLSAQVKYQADVVTSHVISVGEAGTPAWAIDLIYGKNPYSEGVSVPTFYTGNLLLTRKVIEKFNPLFDQRFAMTGASDYHFALKALKQGVKAVYTDAPVIEEFPASRANVKWFIKRGFRSGIGYTRSHLFEEPVLKAIARSSALSAVRFIRGLGYLLLGAVTFNKTTFVNGLFRIASSIGTIAGFFGIKHDEYNTIHGK
ncbi:glycosyltransferase family 2 protein [Thalassotalea sp. LPB0316]|uniref:glycosyltransferase family 2 protein n=1 Tax=Thalassotalea sp. LPB0316 TaxID=2769490 RepID=UPI001866A770|nr:glycosyltransferase family 2 protein [Thalassotalea sp. LPB0316]QOL26487.1 glycosyltransferase family 2 protein [Thalassotalea sp. LPB0316]